MLPPDVIGFASVALPERIAVRTGDAAHSYRELGARARRLARRLRDAGLAPGDRVAILAANCITHYDLLIAAPLAGVIVVPLNTRLPAAELRPLVDQVRPGLLFVDAASDLLGSSLSLPTIRLANYERWLAEASATKLTPVARSEQDLHLILFTGGSTGTPKGACLPYRQTLGNADDSARIWGLKPDDIAIQATPCFHAGAHALSLPLLRAGGTVVVASRFDPSDYLRLAGEHRVTRLFMVPTMYGQLAEDPAFDATDLRPVREALTGGAPCPVRLRDRYAARGIRFRRGFGMTEAGVNCFRGSDGDDDDPQSVGTPMPQVRASIRRPDGTPARTGETGELCLSGPQVCAGYWGTSEHDGSFTADGWLRTGDLASLDARGRYTIRGRIKDLIISGGENIHPIEVEAALLDLPGVREACVFGWPDARWGEVGIGFVVAETGATLNPAEMRPALRRRLAGYKLPADIVVVAELPRSAVGKILKTEARAQYAAMSAAGGTGDALDARLGTAG